MKKRNILIVGLLSALVLGACGGQGNTQTIAKESQTGSAAASQEAQSSGAAGDLKPIKVGASPSPHAEILEVAKPILEKEGYDLQIVTFNDYVQPNVALESGTLDANYFQHLPYLEEYNEKNNTTLVSAASIHYEPFGIYAGKTASLDQLQEGAKVAVPNDVTNEARALLLLADQGLITLKEGAGLTATKADIVENPKNLELFEAEAAQIPRSLQDVDIAVINGNYAIDAGLKVSDALVTEDAKSVAATTYANIIAVKDGDQSREDIQALVEALQSDTVKQFMEEKYQGAVVPMF